MTEDRFDKMIEDIKRLHHAAMQENETIVKCKDCRHKYMKGMGFYCSQRTHALNPEGHCEVGERE